MGSGTRLRVPITAGTTSCCPNLTPAGLGPSVPVGNAGLEPSSSSSSSPSCYPLLGPDLISPPAGRRLTQPRLPLHLQTLKGNGDFRLTFPTSPTPSRFPQAVVIKAVFNYPSAHLPTSPPAGEANEANVDSPVAHKGWVRTQLPSARVSPL